MDLDIFLTELGEYGPYQKRLLFWVFLPCMLPCAFHAYSQLFMAAFPPYCCLNETDNYRNVCVPNSTTICCSEGYKFDNSKYQSTVVTDWNLVCDKKFYPVLALILFAASGFIGNLIFGYLQDRIGRKPSFFWYLLIQVIFGIGTSISWNYWSWLFMRIGVGFTVPAILSTPYVLPIELVGPRYRTRCTIYNNIAYSIGLVLLAAIVYAIRDWRLLALATTVPFLFYFVYLRYMPESPRWLLAIGEYEKAQKVLNEMAKVNKTRLSKDFRTMQAKHLENSQKYSEENCITYGIKDLFRYPNLRKITIVTTFIWFTNTSVYVGLSYYAPALSGNEFLNFFLAGASELPTYIILWPTMEHYGRRQMICGTMLIGGISCLMTVLFTGQMETLILYCIGKMGISSSYVVLPLFASELYPTVVRGVGMSFCSVAGMLGPIFIPLIIYCTAAGSHLPLVTMGTLLVLGGLASLMLPETKDINLPQTITDNGGNK